MPYVHRTALGDVDSLHRQPLPGASEFLDNEHPDVQRFVGNRGAPENFSLLDAEFVRVLEDLIDAMIMKNLITITDLPEHAQAKLNARKNFRDKMDGKTLRLFSNSGLSELVDDTGFGSL